MPHQQALESRSPSHRQDADANLRTSEVLQAIGRGVGQALVKLSHHYEVSLMVRTKLKGLFSNFDKTLLTVECERS